MTFTILLMNIFKKKIFDPIYQKELQLNKSNAPDTDAPFLDLTFSVSKDIISTKIYDKQEEL